MLFSFSALCSGLNLGLLTLTEEELELMVKGGIVSSFYEILALKIGNKKDAHNAKAILPVRRRSNHLLCTLLIVNVVSKISVLIVNICANFISLTLELLYCSRIWPVVRWLSFFLQRESSYLEKSCLRALALGNSQKINTHCC